MQRRSATGCADIGKARRQSAGRSSVTSGRSSHSDLEQRDEVERLARLGLGGVAGEGQHRARHRLDLVEVGEHARALLGVLDELGAQAEPRHRRAQVVGDRGDQLVAVAEDRAAGAPASG